MVGASTKIYQLLSHNLGISVVTYTSNAPQNSIGNDFDFHVVNLCQPSLYQPLKDSPLVRAAQYGRALVLDEALAPTTARPSLWQS